MIKLDSLISKDTRLLSLQSAQRGEGPWLHRNAQVKAAVFKWRKIFQSHGNLINPKIGIVHYINFEYFAIVYAAISLGYDFVVLDHRFDHQSSHKEFMPLDFFVYDDLVDTLCDSDDYWKNNARYLIDARCVEWTDIDQCPEVLGDFDLDFDISKFTMLSSSTSGTTARPKKNSFSYQYLLNVARRNAEVLSIKGRAAHARNLHHGSSLPVFFLPSMMNCDFHLCMGLGNPIDDQIVFDEMIYWIEYLDINHLMLPYSKLLLQFLETVYKKNMKFSDLTLYTLSYIDPGLGKYIKEKNIKIVSIFGCTETSGPIMLNSLTNANADTFDPTVFIVPDNFYNIALLDQGTQIKSADGLINHIMEDRFEQLDQGRYRHLGRSNFYRINDVVLDLNMLENMLTNLNIDGTIVLDSVAQTLYLAVWDQSDCEEAKKKTNDALKKILGSDLVKITVAVTLSRADFISGIKLNQEMIRNHFRSSSI